MRTCLKVSLRVVRTGWYWILGLLILPNCSFEAGGFASPSNLDRGPLPRDAAVFCDIEKPLVGRRCSTEADRAMGIRLAEAATALNTGRTSAIALDDSPDALARCSGQPEAILYEAAFPEGLSICLNCSTQLPAVYPDVNAVCQARCYDMFGTTTSDGTVIPEQPPDPLVVSYCATHAKVSTNFPAMSCFGGACSESGALRDDFVDPRRTPDGVAWTNFSGTSLGGSPNDLTRTAAATGNFDAGAVSTQWFTRGDGYVEFSVGRTDQGQVLGLAQIPPGCPAPCNDPDPGLGGINFGLSLAADGLYYVVENGTVVRSSSPDGSFGSYSAGERFRVSLRDNSDGSASVTYARVVGTCTAGMPCNVAPFHTSSTTARYPLRVDASLRDTGATLSNVRIVHIK